MITIILIPLLGYTFYNLRKEHQFIFYALAYLFPFTTGDLGSVENFMLVEWLTPFFALIVLNDYISLKLRLNDDVSLVKIPLIFWISITALIIVTVYSFLDNQIINQQVTIFRKTGIKRTYYRIAINIVGLLTTAFFVKKHIKEINFRKLIFFILYTSLSLGIIKLISFAFQINVPFLAGNFQYNPSNSSVYNGTTALRLGALERMAALGIPALLAIYYKDKKLLKIPTVLLLMFLIMSGGRTIFFSVGITLVISIIIFFKNKSFVLFGAILVAITLLFVVTPSKIIEGQLNRITSIEGGIKQQDSWRYATYLLYIKVFKENPYFGKGITQYNDYISANEKGSHFAKEQLFSGGHGSYISILSTFGLIGLIYLLSFLLGGLLISYRNFNLDSNRQFKSMYVFIFTVFLIRGFYYLTSYSGLNDNAIFFIAGLLIGLNYITRYERKYISKLKLLLNN